jgi:hypothetical protein
MSYYNLCGIESQHSNISKGKGGGGTYINPLKDVDSRVFTRMLHGKKIYPVTLTFDLENQ